MTVEQTGVVRWYNGYQGFGFVVADDGSPDLFLHRSVVKDAGIRDLVAGDRIAFEAVDTPKGRKATKIRLITA
jgi:CspA family cold shock protein